MFLDAFVLVVPFFLLMWLIVFVIAILNGVEP